MRWGTLIMIKRWIRRGAALVVAAAWGATCGGAALAHAGKGPWAPAGGADPASEPIAVDDPCVGTAPPTGDVWMRVGDRPVLLHVPEAYTPRKTMLVVNAHGYFESIVPQARRSNMNALADEKGFLVLYPQGTGTLPSFNGGDCCGEAKWSGVDDVAFVRAALAHVGKRYCVDPKRVYATGFSNGALLTYELGCSMPDVFAAIAPVAGALGVAPPACEPARPVPVWQAHGTADRIVPYDGGAPPS
jgi:polyhydroxybutyrate depolymerase